MVTCSYSLLLEKPGIVSLLENYLEEQELFCPEKLCIVPNSFSTYFQHTFVI